ncbi:MAG: hypothetical protein HeimC3_48130 [Candidatus Heimdallarchaeota archaeon LC_3]|nr:MAG: hypothetical protein HeimC3_48130 [Candidatus Heimdallarchaeota archaeon LC_3]
MNSEETDATEKKLFERRYDLDWFRTIAVLLVFLFHSMLIFSLAGIGNISILNNEFHVLLDIIVLLLVSIGMPLFFIISGAGTYYALKIIKNTDNLDNKLFIKARFVRLMIPFFIAIFTYISLISYAGRIRPYYNNQPFEGNFIDHYFNGYLFGGLRGLQEGATFLWTGDHLWYLIILFSFSLIFLPLFLLFEKEKNRERLSKIAKRLEKTGLIYLLIIPPIFFVGFDLGMANLGGDISKIWRFLFPITGGWSVLMYIPYFIYGYLFTSHDKQFKKSLEKNSLPALYIAILTAILGLPLLFSFLLTSQGDLSLLGLFTSRALLLTFGWSIIIILLSLVRKYLSFNHKWLKFLNEITLPFYILHMVVLIVVAYFIVQLNLGVFMKLFLLIFISLIIILSLVLIIRQANILRFIFGMKLKKKT